MQDGRQVFGIIAEIYNEDINSPTVPSDHKSWLHNYFYYCNHFGFQVLRHKKFSDGTAIIFFSTKPVSGEKLEGRSEVLGKERLLKYQEETE